MLLNVLLDDKKKIFKLAKDVITHKMYQIKLLLLSGCTLILNCYSAFSQANIWAAFTGSSTMANVSPVYGTLGISSPANTPGTRKGAVTWTDNSGNLWLYGGNINSIYGTGSDLWKYNTTTHEWTWMHGSNMGNVFAVYGTQGVPSPSNSPGFRLRSHGWTDANGDLWLYSGFNSSAADDLWKYSMSSNEWTWVKGSNAGSTIANFGISGFPSLANTPGTRSDGVTGTDSLGNLWLFGGYGVTSTVTSGPMGDLWKYDISSNCWTWISGVSQVSANGNYAQFGTPSPGVYPGARYAATGGTDNAGNFWIFGGNGNPQSGYGILNDLWKYNFSTGLWTWAAGSSSSGSPGNYGTKGIPSANNSPPKRFYATMHSDNLGNVWLFGGNDGTLLSSVSTASHSGNYNDLWRFDNTTGEWTWMAGDNTWDKPGVYGPVGVSGPAYKPGARHLHQMWKDNNGALWIFGGEGGISTLVSSGWYSDLWKYGTCNPPTSSVNPMPLLTVACSSVICLGETTTMSVTGSPGYTLYNTGSANPTVISVPYVLIEPTQSTTYVIKAVSANSCASSAKIEVSVSECTSLETHKVSYVNVFPNPFKQRLKIAATEADDLKVTIFDMRGQMVFSEKLNLVDYELDLEELDPGLYFLYLEDHVGKPPVKIIKE